MQGVKRALAGATILVLALCAVALAGTSITVDDEKFTPAKPPVLNVEQTNYVWQWVGQEEHNVRQDKKLFRSGDPVVDDSFSIEPSAGTFHYYCENHGSKNGGMDGLLRVRPRTVKNPVPAPLFTVRWSGGIDTGNRYGVRFRVGHSKQWRKWRGQTTNFQEVFGEDDDPVDVKPGKTYRFQARSFFETSKKSDWSPTLKVTAGPG